MSSHGFTLAELLVVIAIIGILALCVARALEGATNRADVVRCMGNLRGLHIALATDLTDRGHWPQCPHEVGDDAYDGWWLQELSKYQISKPNWICPTLERRSRVAKKDHDKDKFKLHYTPTPFDDNPFTPRKWPNMPWLIEVADGHGEGNLIVFPNGAIIGSARYLGQAQ